MSDPVLLAHDWFPRPLPENVTLGEGSWCYSSFAFLHYASRRPRGVRVGKHSGLYHGTFFDLGPEGEVEIGDYCTLVGVIIATNSRIVIADCAFLAHEVVLADSFASAPPAARVGSRGTEAPTSHSALRTPHSAFAPRLLTPAATEPGIFLGENCWVGARAVLLSGARLGEGSIVGAAAVVDFAIPPFSVVAGNPARVVGPATNRPIH